MFLCMLLGTGVWARDYLFDRAICTGMGDRVGTLLTLAALARSEGGTVVFRWCNNPIEVYSRIHPHIPRWRGYNYSIAEFRSRFSVPHEVILVESITEKHKLLPLVQWSGVGVPAEHGSDSVYTVAWKTTRLSRVSQLSASEFKEAYQAVARPLSASGAAEQGLGVYVAVHLRGPDDNTYSPPSGAWDDLAMYCTGKVLQQVLALNVTLVAVSNNVVWANELLGGRLRVRDGGTAYDDFSLLLGASGIVQHAWGGWSSYSSVPALASGMPVINTFRGSPQRSDLFREQGGVPREMYSCSRRGAFMHALGVNFAATRVNPLL